MVQNSSMRIQWGCLTGFLGALVLAAPLAAQRYDIVLANGRVIDPETNLDAVRNVGIRGGKIRAVSETPLEGQTVVDVKGMVVAARTLALGAIELFQNPDELKSARDSFETRLAGRKWTTRIPANGKPPLDYATK